jgi:hypothetical protein
MENNIRTLTVCPSVRDHSKITLTGAWLEQWGYTVGDRIAVTKTDSGDILIKRVPLSAEECLMEKKKKLEIQLQSTLMELDFSKTA